jgi:hypothetical protein
MECVVEVTPVNGPDPTSNPPPSQNAAQTAPRSLAQRLLPGGADAEAVSRRVLAEVEQVLPGRRDAGILPACLPELTVRAVLAHRTRKKSGDPDASAKAAPEAVSAELRRVTQQAVLRLPRMYCHVFVLADVEGLSLDTVARVLGVNRKVAGARLQRARLLVDDALAPFTQELDGKRVRRDGPADFHRSPAASGPAA